MCWCWHIFFFSSLQVLTFATRPKHTLYTSRHTTLGRCSLLYISRAKMSKNVVSSFSKKKKQDAPPPQKKIITKKKRDGSFLSLKSSLFLFLAPAHDIFYTHSALGYIQVRRRWWCVHTQRSAQIHTDPLLYTMVEKKEVSGILASFQYGDDGLFFFHFPCGKKEEEKKKKRRGRRSFFFGWLKNWQCRDKI